VAAEGAIDTDATFGVVTTSSVMLLHAATPAASIHSLA
jgi:hypothetical protein